MNKEPEKKSFLKEVGSEMADDAKKEARGWIKALPILALLGAIGGFFFGFRIGGTTVGLVGAVIGAIGLPAFCAVVYFTTSIFDF